MSSSALPLFTALAILSAGCFTGSAIMFTLLGKAIAKKETKEYIVPAVFLMIMALAALFADFAIYTNSFCIIEP